MPIQANEVKDSLQHNRLARPAAGLQANGLRLSVYQLRPGMADTASAGTKFVHCILRLDNPHYAIAMNDRPPEQSRSEPEIIPPGFDEYSPRKRAGIWVRIDEHDGVRRVVITQPRPAAMVLGLLVLCLIAGIAFLVVAGLLLVWIPVVIAGVLLAFAIAAIRRQLRLLRARWLPKR